MEDKNKRRRPSRRRVKKEDAPQRRKSHTDAPAASPQDVVYTAPEPVNRKKLILYIATAVAVVLALFMACSIFFKVDKVKISGNRKYDDWTVFEASGIEKGDSLLTFGRSKACARIAQKLPYVKIVRVGITLPDTVNIYIEELDVVYSVQDGSGNWWLLTSDGRVVEKTTEEKAGKHTNIHGVLLDAPVAGKKAQALEIMARTMDQEEDPVVITNQDRLNTALTIAYELERRGIMNTVSIINVEDMTAIELWYGATYQIKLGNAGEMDKKLDLMKATIEKRENDGTSEGGILDITLEIYPDGVGFEAFEEEEK